MINFKFWFAYLTFLLGPRGSSLRVKSAKKMSRYASTFRHCAIMLYPTQSSAALERRRDQIFEKAVTLAKRYEDARLLCSCATTQMDKEKAFSVMIKLTPINSSDGQIKELIHDYGIILKISWARAEALSHLRLLRTKLKPDDPRADEFIRNLIPFEQSQPHGTLNIFHH